MRQRRMCPHFAPKHAGAGATRGSMVVVRAGQGRLLSAGDGADPLAADEALPLRRLRCADRSSPGGLLSATGVEAGSTTS